MSNPMRQESGSFSMRRIVRYWSRPFQESMRIYRDEFPADSRLSVARIRTLLTAGQYQLFVAQKGGAVAGFALIWISRHPAFVHLDYIAVRQDQKGQGIGTILYRWLTTHLQELCPRSSLLTLEVDDELIPFYRRSRTYVLHNTPYMFPGRFGPLPMYLMVYDRRQRRILPRRLIQGVIRALYRDLHHRPAGDSLLRSFLFRIPQLVRLV